MRSRALLTATASSACCLAVVLALRSCVMPSLLSARRSGRGARGRLWRTMRWRRAALLKRGWARRVRCGVLSGDLASRRRPGSARRPSARPRGGGSSARTTTSLFASSFASARRRLCAIAIRLAVRIDTSVFAASLRRSGQADVCGRGSMPDRAECAALERTDATATSIGSGEGVALEASGVAADAAQAVPSHSSSVADDHVVPDRDRRSLPSRRGSVQQPSLSELIATHTRAYAARRPHVVARPAMYAPRPP